MSGKCPSPFSLEQRVKKSNRSGFARFISETNLQCIPRGQLPAKLHELKINKKSEHHFKSYMYLSTRVTAGTYTISYII